jgi:hypothetical protein
MEMLFRLRLGMGVKSWYHSYWRRDAMSMQLEVITELPYKSLQHGGGI